MTPLVATYALLIPLLCPGALTGVDEALAAWKEGESLEGRISKKLGIEAAGRITSKRSRADVRALARIGWEGSAHLNVATRLVGLVVDDERAADVGLAYLHSLRPQTLKLAVKGREDRWRFALERQARFGEEHPGELARSLLVRDGDPARVVRIIEAYASEADEDGASLAFVRGMLRATRGSLAPRELLAALAKLRLSDKLTPALTEAFGELVRRNDECALGAIELVEMGEFGSGLSLFRALVYVPGSLKERTLALYWGELDEGDEATRAVAIECAAAQKLPELVALIDTLIQPPNPPVVRVAAIRAIPRVFEFGVDSNTLATLLLLLADPDPQVRDAVHRVLKTVSGLNLSARVELWEQWQEKAQGGTEGTSSKRLRRSGAGGGSSGGGFTPDPGFKWGVDPPAAVPRPRAPAPPPAKSSAAVAMSVTVSFLLGVFALALLTRKGPRRRAAVVLDMPKVTPTTRSRRRGVEAWSESFSRKALVAKAPGLKARKKPAKPKDAFAEHLEKMVDVIDEAIPVAAPEVKREGPSPWTMKLKRLVAGGGLKVYQEDEEVEELELSDEAQYTAIEDAAPSDDVPGSTAVVDPADRLPLATQKLSRLLAGDDLSTGDEPGKITAIINAISAPAPKQQQSEYDRKREEDDRRLWAIYEGLDPKEGKAIRKEAVGMIPSDVAEGTQLYEDALRIRIRHLVRDREHKQAYTTAREVVVREATEESGAPDLDEAELEAQMLAVQQNEVLAKVLDDFVGPDDPLDPTPSD